MSVVDLKELEKQEFIKRNNELCLIASEGFPSEEVLEAQSSIFSVKYAEGRAEKRYYNGCEVFDDMEKLGEQKLLQLFNAPENYNACIQPHSGSQANMIVYGAILQPNDVVLSMDVQSGSHISHNHKLSFIGKYHKVISYGLDDNGIINYEQVEELALKHKPKLIIVGCSAYSQKIDYKRFKDIADKVGAYTMADIAHITSLIVTGLHDNPLNYDYDFVTMTTHKMLNCCRGGCIIYKRDYEKNITRGVIPFCQGGPLGNMMYSKTVGFNNILKNMDEFKKYTKDIVESADLMAKTFQKNGIPIVSGGTQNHLMLLDLSSFYCSGKKMAETLEECGIICNCNAIPNDKRSFLETSGIRIGTPNIIARGVTLEECGKLAQLMSNLIKLYKVGGCELGDIFEIKEELKEYVKYLTQKNDLKLIYPNMYNRLFQSEV